MPLQNRVAPNGELHAVAARGTLMGNRGGRFHRDDQTIGRRRHASTHWICCDLHYKSAHHDPMGQGYTSLFFLDEVTALAAGHRPCFYCRRAEAKAFLNGERVGPFDAALHRQRLGLKPVMAVSAAPDGSMFEEDGVFFAKRRGRLLRWSFDGYDEAKPIKAAMQLKLLTALAFTAILARGYQPRWHASAFQWDTQ